LGERIIVTGRVLDEAGRPVPNTLIEVWQANAAGRYIHVVDQHDAPLDPNFLGGGRCVTDAEGRYRFMTVKPGAYPWGNHHNAWRPNHIHFSLFGPAFLSRLVTQMYFPGDPLLTLDPIYQSTPEGVRERADLDVFDRRHRARLCAGLRLRHRAAWSCFDPDGDLSLGQQRDAVADRRTLLRLRPDTRTVRLRFHQHCDARGDDRRNGRRTHPYRRGASSTATASRSPMR
jgi:protocatechuate 3,4-dioxygenase beta subunit